MPNTSPKVDYDLWLGPAPKQPFNRNRFHYNWHWHWDFGNGDTGNQGPHQFDIARWGLGKQEHPIRVRSVGGYFGPESSQDDADVQTSLYEYADGTILEFGTRGEFTNDENGVNVGNLFYGSKGWLSINGSRWQSELRPQERERARLRFAWRGRRPARERVGVPALPELRGRDPRERPEDTHLPTCSKGTSLRRCRTWRRSCTASAAGWSSTASRSPSWTTRKQTGC